MDNILRVIIILLLIVLIIRENKARNYEEPKQEESRDEIERKKEFKNMMDYSIDTAINSYKRGEYR